MSSHKVNLTFTDESIKDIETLSKNLNVGVEIVIGQALALLKWAQGRRVILKSDKESVEVNNFKDLPPQVDLKVK